MKKHIFTHYHSLIIFIYFCGVIIFTMSNLEPFYVLLSLITSGIYYAYLNGSKAFFKSMAFYIPILLIIAFINCLVNSLGLTVLFYIKDKPITLEALCFGLCEGGMLISVIMWFACYTKVMSSDKFLGLFGKIAPTVSLMLSMVLRYIPDNILTANQIKLSQQAIMGNKPYDKKRKIKSSIRLTSVLMGYNLENSIETADSMRARGYGIKKRSAHTYEKFTYHDIISLIVIIILIALNVFFMFIKSGRFNFYPIISMPQKSISEYLTYGILLLYPLILEAKEQILWKRCHL